jgi:crossover junction endodeoxyribonuclease RusA
MICLTLPYPPSANALWRSFNGRNIASRSYRAWTTAALAEIAAQKPPATIQGDYWLMLIAGRPDRRRRDLGNLEKPVSDALVKAGVIADDCNATEILLAWSDDPPSRAARVVIHVAPGPSPLRAQLPNGEVGSK